MYYGTEKEIPGYAPYAGDKVYVAGSSVTSLGYAKYSNRVFLAGDSSTYYEGNGTSGYLRGSSVSVTKQGSEYDATAFRTSSSGTYRNVSVISTALYYGGSSKTYYQGTGAYVVDRGDKVTVAKLGSNVIGLYERDSSQDKTYTVIGDEVDSTTLYVRDETLDDVWVKASNTCSLNLASFVTRSVTALTV